MDSVSPVLTEREILSEQVVALDQTDLYRPIIVARIRFSDSSPASFTRYRFTDKERELIAKGADLLIWQPHHGMMMPIGLQLAMPEQYPETE